MVLESAVLGNRFESPHLGACLLEKQEWRESCLVWRFERALTSSMFPPILWARWWTGWQKGVTTWTLCMAITGGPHQICQLLKIDNTDQLQSTGVTFFFPNVLNPTFCITSFFKMTGRWPPHCWSWTDPQTKPASRVCDLHGHRATCFAWFNALLPSSWISHFLNRFWTMGWHFHFALGPANYVVGTAH